MSQNTSASRQREVRQPDPFAIRCPVCGSPATRVERVNVTTHRVTLVCRACHTVSFGVEYEAPAS